METAENSQRGGGKLITIITDKSDNGNEFLCLKCMHGKKRSGLAKEVDVVCTASFRSPGYPGQPRFVSFVVTQCDAYVPRAIQPPNDVYEAMKRQAWYVDSSQEGRGLVLIPPDEAARRDII